MCAPTTDGVALRKRVVPVARKTRALVWVAISYVWTPRPDSYLYSKLLVDAVHDHHSRRPFEFDGKQGARTDKNIEKERRWRSSGSWLLQRIKLQCVKASSEMSIFLSHVSHSLITILMVITFSTNTRQFCSVVPLNVLGHTPLRPS